MATQYEPVDRAEHARAIVARGDVRPWGPQAFLVRSEAHDNVWYKASATGCTCIDYQIRGLPCKHMLAVRLHLEATQPRCEHCGAGGGLVSRPRYFGGAGYRQVVECQDKRRCAARQDAQQRKEAI